MPIKPITTMVNTYIFIMINDITMISYFLTYPRLPDPPIMARRQGGGEGPAPYQGDHYGTKVVVIEDVSHLIRKKNQSPYSLH